MNSIITTWLTTYATIDLIIYGVIVIAIILSGFFWLKDKVKEFIDNTRKKNRDDHNVQADGGEKSNE